MKLKRAMSVSRTTIITVCLFTPKKDLFTPRYIGECLTRATKLIKGPPVRNGQRKTRPTGGNLRVRYTRDDTQIHGPQTISKLKAYAKSWFENPAGTKNKSEYEHAFLSFSCNPPTKHTYGKMRCPKKYPRPAKPSLPEEILNFGGLQGLS